MQKIKDKIVEIKNKILAYDKSQLVSKKRKKMILIAVAVVAVIVILSIAS